MKDFDVVIIGSGIGGLISAGILASKGLKPLLLEAHKSPGGYLSSFRRKDFIFDSAVDCVSGTGPDGIIGRVLASLGTGQGIKFIRLDPVRSSIFPDFTVDVDSDINLYIERLIKLFPAESNGIKSFFETASDVYKSVMWGIEMLSGRDGGAFMISPDILKYRDNTYEGLLREHIHDGRLRAVLSDRCPFAGLPPSRIAALPMVMMIMSYFMQGAYRPAGGFQRLSDALAGGIRKAGGKVILGSRVTRILHDSGRCVAVACKNGEEYSCGHVISNADFTHTLRDLLGGGYASIAERMIVSPGVSTSFFIVYAGIRGEFSGHSSIGYYPSYDMASLFGPEASFSRDGTIGITVASVEDKLRAPAGCHTVVLHEMVEAGAEGIDKDRCASMVFKKAEQIIPGLTGGIEVLDSATPETLRRYTSNFGGSAFGWNLVPGMPSPDIIGLDNLYIAGHWGDMGGGVLAAAYSGLKAAAGILRKEGIPVAF